MAKQHDLDSWLLSLRGKGTKPVGASVARGLAETLLPAGGEDWVDGETADEPLTELHFDDWPIEARLRLEEELQERNMEHLWRGARLLVPSRLEATLDELLDELAAQAARTADAGAAATSGTRWCPTCEGEFVAGIETCPDCGVPLVDRPPSSGASRGGSGPTARYDLSSWSHESRYILSHQLAGDWPLFGLQQIVPASTARGLAPAALAHAWDGDTLVVRERDAATVETMMAGVEHRVELALDPDVDKLAYDVDDLSDESLTLLLRSLVDAGVPHELSEDGELFVHERDEEAVERLFDRIDFPDELDAQADEDLDDPDDGLNAQQVLSDVFEACDRLTHDPHNADAILELVRGDDALDGLAVPFGFDRAEWQGLVARVGALRAVLEADGELDADTVLAQARELRDALHSLV